ncbi:MAG: hypothetical protein KC713_06990, partial [Candidatus Omnitrophica bacterium]|nr:hypothetical protein [Candidatus Omnitrophota bacterium]
MKHISNSILFDTAICILATLLAFWLYLPWSPEISYDTYQYYYPSLDILEDSHSTLAQRFVRPFFRAVNPQPVQADESKPLFIVLLRAWGLIYKTLQPHQTIPNANMYNSFMFISCVLLGLAILEFSRIMKGYFLGVICVFMTILNPWHLIFLYFPAYTQISMAFYLFAFMALMSPRNRSTFQGGLLASMAVLSNPSMIVYVVGLLIFVLWQNWRDFQKLWKRWSLFILGCGFLFIILKFAALIYNEHSSTHQIILSPLETLQHYYQRSLTSSHFQQSLIPKYPGMFLLILFHVSKILFGICIIIPFYYCYEIGKRGVSAFFQDENITAVTGLLLPVVLSLILIECGPSVQLGRSYFIAFPIMILAVLFLLRSFWHAHGEW